jgi:GNAT superfamily N-acetyltransferase
MDMLVRLFDLQGGARAIDDAALRGVTVRRAMPYEMRSVTAWVAARFGGCWEGECMAAFAGVPAACWIATVAGRIAGFACHDATCRGFFGPMGVEAGHRSLGIGRALLMGCLGSMRDAGYAYAVIGGVDPSSAEFYRRCARAEPIPGSEPGVYRDRLLESQ